MFPPQRPSPARSPQVVKLFVGPLGLGMHDIPRPPASSSLFFYPFNGEKKNKKRKKKRLGEGAVGQAMFRKPSSYRSPTHCLTLCTKQPGRLAPSLATGVASLFRRLTEETPVSLVNPMSEVRGG
ncbi:hypothetical protein SODALDRAFT_328098 [Sodiomyces alkalinus F11]|uniref:Uncharacterized protein n=1 Tax=Sodiomyces alkalinus (strain CBS 110278 / VKM F-3762 / F11) TaxID=1314773 RepID=A0A3N2PMT0_SODAK|nr:hypothetical protein SODALDRAFT_328098 [Sodiomyces alkalinus F11]ROT35714.1 hypothetical protein SODALDRAFT_328098 [Sodiomyces alkalinus F11]